MSETTVQRNEAVPGNIVVPAYIKGRKAGLTNQQIADGLGMKKTTLTVRISQLRKRYKADAELKAAKGETVVNPFDAVDAQPRKRIGNVFDAHKDALAELAEVDGEPEAATEAVAS